MGVRTIDVRLLIADDADPALLIEQLVEKIEGPDSPVGAVELLGTTPCLPLVVGTRFNWWNGEHIKPPGCICDGGGFGFGPCPAHARYERVPRNG
jgi:hypothetical protein